MEFLSRLYFGIDIIDTKEFIKFKLKYKKTTSLQLLHFQNFSEMPVYLLKMLVQQ
jgi:hypothetical protein